MEQLLSVLNDQERDLVRETEPARMDVLDEDELISLHSRVRRARTKHQKNYRRRASAGVQEHGGRGKSRPKNTRAAQQAEVFEEVLARVSARLEVVARQSAQELKEQRLAAAQANRSTGPDSGSPGEPDAADAGLARTHKKTTGGTKRDASSQAAGAKRQARRDSR